MEKTMLTVTAENEEEQKILLDMLKILRGLDGDGDGDVPVLPDGGPIVGIIEPVIAYGLLHGLLVDEDNLIRIAFMDAVNLAYKLNIAPGLAKQAMDRIEAANRAAYKRMVDGPDLFR